MAKSSLAIPIGTLGFVADQQRLFLRVTLGWRSIEVLHQPPSSSATKITNSNFGMFALAARQHGVIGRRWADELDSSLDGFAPLPDEWRAAACQRWSRHSWCQWWGEALAEWLHRSYVIGCLSQLLLCSSWGSSGWMNWRMVIWTGYLGRIGCAISKPRLPDSTARSEQCLHPGYRMLSLWCTPSSDIYPSSTPRCARYSHTLAVSEPDDVCIYLCM